jgi:DNA repair protein RadD
MKTLKPLRAHQKKALNDLDAVWRDDPKAKPIIFLPTGSGKTRLAAEIARKALRKRQRVAFFVPLKNLMKQTRDEFIAAGIPEDLINIWHHQHNQEEGSTARPIQITTFDTATKKWRYDPKKKRWLGPAFDLGIVDECHVRRKYFFKRLDRPGKSRFVGLSATPWARSLGAAWTGGLIEPARMDELIDQKLLIPPRIFAKPSPDLAKVGLSVMKDGVTDYNQAELADAMIAANDVTADIIKTWRDQGEDRPTFVFGVNKTHAQKLMARFVASRVVKKSQCAFICDETPEAERERIREGFQSGEIKIVFNVALLTMGIDWPVGCIVVARPTRSPILWVQMIGRGLRPNKGFKDCLVFDHSSSVVNNGLPETMRFDLDVTGRAGKLKRVTNSKTKVCPNPDCLHANHPAARVCKECGAELIEEKGLTESKEIVLMEVGRRANQWGVDGLSRTSQGWLWARMVGGVTHTSALGGKNVSEKEAQRLATLCNNLLMQGETIEHIRARITKELGRGSCFGVDGLSRNTRGQWEWQRMVGGVKYRVALGGKDVSEKEAVQLAKLCNTALAKGKTIAQIRARIAKEPGRSNCFGVDGLSRSIRGQWLWARMVGGVNYTSGLGGKDVSEKEAKRLATLCNELLAKGRSIDEIRAAVAEVKSDAAPGLKKAA